MDVSVKWLGENDPRGILVLKSTADQKELLKERYESDKRFDVTLLLDTSGSMRPHSDMLNTSLTTMKKILPKCANLRTIVFDDYAREHFGKSILVSSGKTNLVSALELIKNTENPQLVLLLSDGYANAGQFTTPREILDFSRALFTKNDLPIIFTTIGFNSPENLQLEILNGLANITDGNSHIVQTKDGVYQAFGDIISDLISIAFADISFVGIQSEPKLHGYHLRVGETREIPFKYTGDNLEINSYNLETRKWCQTSIPLEVGKGPIDEGVREIFLIKEGQDLLKEHIDATEHLFSLSRNIHDPFEDQPFYASPSLQNAFVRSPNRFCQTIKRLNDEARVQNIEKLRSELFTPIETKIKDFLLNLPHTRLLDKVRTELENLKMSRNDFSGLAFDLSMRRSRIGGNIFFEATASQEAGRHVSLHVSQNPDADGQELLSQRF
jgi:hypothetical protein